ncbi:MAG: ATP synthase subunit B family protein [Thiobacillus sp.]
MHALTVQYYEVLQIYRTETALARCDRVVFVPFRLFDFANVDLLRRFRAALIDAALAPTVRDALVNFDMLELVPERRVVFSGLGGSIAEVLENPRIVIRPARLARRRPPGEEEPAPEGEPPEPPEPEEEPPTRPPRPGRADDVAGTLWETAASKLSSFFGTPSVRRNSQSLFVPSDVQIEEGAVQSTVRTIKLVFVLRDSTRIVDLSASVALSEVDSIALLGSNPAADTPATAVLALSRNGVVFPLELPTVTVEKGAQETKLIDVRAAGAEVNLVQHLMDNRLYYSQAVFRSLDPAMIAGLLAPFSITLNGRNFPLVQVAEPIPLRIVGNALAFKINTDPVNDQEWRDFMVSRGLVIGQSKVDIVPLSSGGIFAEAVLGRFNCAEKLDMSRFFNWQDSPIPIQPTDIAAIQTGSRARDENLTPGQLSQPLVSISQPASLPDPTGLAGTLAAIQNGAMFRDMSGLADTIKLATETAKLSAAGATAVGQQAGEAMKTAVSADTERRKIAADLEKAKVQAATDLAKAKLGKSLQDKNITEAGAVVNKEEELKKKRQEQAKAAGGASGGAGNAGGGAGGGAGSSTGSGSGGGTGGGTRGGGGGISAPRSTGNSALDRIIGNDESLRAFIGLSPDSPVPTPAVTDEGVPLQDWDFIGGGYSLFYQETNAGPRELAAGAQVEEIIAADFWTPTKAEDFRSLLLGDRKVLTADFGDLLFALALMPAGTMRALNIVAYAKNNRSLALTRDFIYTKSEESFTIRDAEPTTLSALDLQKLISLTDGAPISTSDGDIKLADVRKAFAVDGEVRIFNLETALSPEYVQAMANFFQVRAAGFVKKQVRVAAEVIAITENGDPVLDTKASLHGDPVSQAVDLFVNLLQQDRAQTGLFTAFPRRG